MPTVIHYICASQRAHQSRHMSLITTSALQNLFHTHTLTNTHISAFYYKTLHFPLSAPVCPLLLSEHVCADWENSVHDVLI